MMDALPSLSPGTRRFLHSCLILSLWRQSGAAQVGLPPQHQRPTSSRAAARLTPPTAAPVPGQPHLPSSYLLWSSHSRGYQPVKARLRPWYKLVLPVGCNPQPTCWVQSPAYLLGAIPSHQRHLSSAVVCLPPTTYAYSGPARECLPVPAGPTCWVKASAIYAYFSLAGELPVSLLAPHHLGQLVGCA